MLPNPQETADLVIFTEETLIEDFIFCAVVLGIARDQYDKCFLRFSYLQICFLSYKTKYEKRGKYL